MNKHKKAEGHKIIRKKKDTTLQVKRSAKKNSSAKKTPGVEDCAQEDDEQPAQEVQESVNDEQEDVPEQLPKTPGLAKKTPGQSAATKKTPGQKTAKNKKTRSTALGGEKKEGDQLPVAKNIVKARKESAGKKRQPEAAVLGGEEEEEGDAPGNCTGFTEAIALAKKERAQRKKHEFGDKDDDDEFDFDLF